ncbi:unnamed protein product [Somion occarium]|uniref:Uncharacterized protein n=1 Tax=Somion occarium TaxID=3059160 RepID=A0ABP1DEI2_9APHY
MTSTRPPVPPVNLKDRIAALQQRNVIPNTHAQHGTSVMSSSTSLGTTGSLRDKIATFEKQGAVPVPRGSFGIGAPPVDDGSSKRRGELYGNRVPGLSKPAIESIPAARKRTASSSHLSSSSISLSRPVTPTFAEGLDVEPIPPVPSGSGSLFNLSGNGTAQLPSTVPNAGRRVVSDVLPQKKASYGSDDVPITETVEEHPVSPSAQSLAEDATRKIPADDPVAPSPHEVESMFSNAPAIVVSPETMEADTPSQPPPDATDYTFTAEDQGNVVLDHTGAVVLSSTNSSSSISMPDVHSESPSPSSTTFEKSEEALQSPLDAAAEAHSEVSTAAVDASVSTPSTASVFSEPQSPLSGEQATSLHLLIDRRSPSQELPSTVGETPSDFTPSPHDTPSDVASIGPSPLRTVAVDKLPIITQVEISPVSSSQSLSVFDVTSAEPSPVRTPADSVFSEASVASQVSSVAVDISLTAPAAPLSAGDSLPATPLSASSEQVAFPRTPPPVSHIISAPSDDAVGEDSLALDTSEAVIVSDPLYISPTVTRGKLIPAPRPPNPSPPVTPLTANTVKSQASSSSSTSSPILRVNLAPLVSPTPSEDWLIDNQSHRKSFHSVVHQKVRQTSSAASSPVDGPTPSRRINDVQNIAKVQLDSPKFDDLAGLVLNASLLEEQLSGEPPRKAAPLVLPSESVNPELVSVAAPPTPQTPDLISEPPRTPVRVDSLAEYQLQQRPEPSQELPESVEEDGPSEVERDLAKEMEVHFTRSWNPDLVALPDPGSSSLPYLAATPPQSPAAFQTSYESPSRDSLSGTPVRMRTVSHSPSPSRMAPTRLRTISHHNLSRSSEERPPTPPPKSPRNYLNTLMRRPTMPGTPRNSVSSEDSSVLVATPPSPPLPPPHDHDSRSMAGSDSSSIMSSTKSWKSGVKEKGLSRATSVMDRLWRRGKNKHSSVTVVNAGGVPHRGPSPTHLSPFNLPSVPGSPPVRESSTSSLQQRPSSWVSIETTGSSYDPDIFDAFPSVPDEVPPVSSKHLGQSLNAMGQRRPASSAPHTYPSTFLAPDSEFGYASSDIGRPTTVPSRANSHAKQRSAVV